MGQLLDSHSRVRGPVRGPVRGMLFNADAIWLCASFSGHPQRLVKSRWAARGSRKLVCRFFSEELEPPPLVLLLRCMCREIAVAPCRVKVPGDRAKAISAFLGAGGSARVICVTKAGAPEELRALKVSTILSRGELEHDTSRRGRRYPRKVSPPCTLRSAVNLAPPTVTQTVTQTIACAHAERAVSHCVAALPNHRTNECRAVVTSQHQARGRDCWRAHLGAPRSQ